MTVNGWNDPTEKLLYLEEAIKTLCGQGTIREKLTAATDRFIFWEPTEFPETMRARFELVRDARARASRPCTGGVYCDFGKKRSEHAAVRQAILDLYRACLLDLGASGDRQFIEISYPSQR